MKCPSIISIRRYSNEGEPQQRTSIYEELKRTLVRRTAAGMLTLVNAGRFVSKNVIDTRLSTFFSACVRQVSPANARTTPYARRLPQRTI